MYKCSNNKCVKYLDNKEKLTPEEKEMRKKKSSQFKLRYIYREYMINLKNIVRKEFKVPIDYHIRN